MQSIVYLSILFTVGISTLFIPGFRDISESVPKQNIGFTLGLGLSLQLFSEQPLEDCIETCLKSGFFCNSFIVLATEEGTECTMFPTLGSVFKPSQVRRNSVIAAYERESLPTTYELFQRFSNSSSDQQVMELSSKYAVERTWDPVIQNVLKTCSTALEKNLPIVVSITDWLRTGDLANSKVRHQSEFREQLFRAIESWQAWPRNPQAPLRYPDVLILTFMDIFFKNLDERITAIYDPIEKTLIVEESEKHILIRSFGPGDYILIFAQNARGSPLIPQWAAYGRKRPELDRKTLGMFKGAMKRFGYNVSDDSESLLPFTRVIDSHTLSLTVLVDAITLTLADLYLGSAIPGFEILFHDLVTALVFSVIENEKTLPFRSNLRLAMWRSGFKPGVGDIDIITN